MAQDLPPQGGYPQIVFKPKGTARGPSGLVIWSTAFVVVAAGFYRVGQTNIQKRQERKVQREARLAIAPVLQAEEDYKYVAARRAGSILPNTYKTPNQWFPPSK
uniref:NADH dehydrogenase [ubiquinone] 1 alpha subcomplex subunit 13 n=1 Tax=Rhizochromulina marina TaxID=1034831 RepID=A0A7S2W6Y4_9STRA|mmetsp:Transcript_1626/g.4840  ORF Transcript_1626/g.4840 Transcript_1626/m.4840 type:complete len:104 (+) Transcript_1626:23-334(+)|eukprot:CAMPEP_0118973562 /NCGR_PEP_ID=MMETSP1173-20130426/10433_1 /TAXON_ID=1034831 /ORGANISM="Rhizochromulina marina cf, Strain CCMP1243" /LENGTH=103 /DNA_ID=CAMNT_0006923239 /DNA_START=23 /DNA_END=334 /DNA_ORIENTATION=+